MSANFVLLTPDGGLTPSPGQGVSSSYVGLGRHALTDPRIPGTGPHILFFDGVTQNGMYPGLGAALNSQYFTLFNNGIINAILSQAQIDAIVSPPQGLQVFNSDALATQTYSGSGWSSGGGGGGGVSGGANVGTGQGAIFKALSGSTLTFKKLAQGTNVTITDDGSEITIASTAAGFAFAIIQTDTGTFPTAATSADTLTLTSSDLTILGNSTTDSVTFTLKTVPVNKGGTNSIAALNNNRIMISQSGAIVEQAAITASRVLVSDVNGLPVASTITTTALAFLDATSSIQTQLNSKAPKASPSFTGTIGTALTASSVVQTDVSGNLTTGLVTISQISATGTPSSTTYLRGDGSWATVSGGTNPLTTLGDTLYGGASGVQTRLAGNTAAAKNFLVQTGNGTVSAAPVWGAITGADLPNPSASTLGGIQSIAATTSNWIRSISTSGVPALSQPAFSDISGLVTVAQISATGTPSSSTYLRGDGAWAAAGGGSSTSTPTASTASAWDANVNMSANSFINGYATTVTAAQTVTLTVSSAPVQYATGASTAIYKLPVASTLALNQTFLIVNRSSGVVTVQSSGANVIQAMATGTQLLVTCILTSGTTAASWDATYLPNSLANVNQSILFPTTNTYNIGNSSYTANPSNVYAYTAVFAGAGLFELNFSGATGTAKSNGTVNFTISSSGAGMVMKQALGLDTGWPLYCVTDGNAYIGFNTSLGYARPAWIAAKNQMDIGGSSSGATLKPAVRILAPAEITTTDATVTTIATLAPPSGTIAYYEAVVMGFNSSNSSKFRLNATVTNLSGTVVVAATEALGTDFNPGTFGGLTWTVSGSNVLLQVTGKAATTISWSAKVVQTSNF